MGLFGTAHGWMGGGEEVGEAKKLLSLKSCNGETWYSYTLAKEDSKNI